MNKILSVFLLSGLFLSGCVIFDRGEGNRSSGDSDALSGSVDHLTTNEWSVVSIGGVATLDEGKPSLIFMEDGRLAGSASCNRIIGSYELGDGGTIKLGQVGVTMMACSEERMLQERRFLEALEEIDGFAFDEEGRLLLTGGSGLLIEAVKE